MRLSIAAAVAALCLTPLAAPAAPGAKAAEPPVQVMIVGGFHMANPGHDMHNVSVDDVLAPRRQAEIVAITNSLARFKPTKVAVEWPRAIVEERYPKYLAGTLAPSRNEVVQLGFRLAKTAGAQGVYGIDADGDFPFEPVKAYAEAHGMGATLQAQDAAVVRMVAQEQALLTDKGIAATLRWLNDPAQVNNGFYRAALRVGGGDVQPGADLVTAWYRRNFLICANLLQLARPGDRIVVFYGSGHGFLLRQCVSETPGLKLVEPNAYLPK